MNKAECIELMEHGKMLERMKNLHDKDLAVNIENMFITLIDELRLLDINFIVHDGNRIHIYKFKGNEYLYKIVIHEFILVDSGDAPEDILIMVNDFLKGLK